MNIKPPKNHSPIPDSSVEELENFFQQRDNRLLHFTPEEERIFPLMDQLQKQTNRYDAIEFYAKGGSKEVFKVFDQSTGRFIAMASLKEEYASDKDKQEQFLREARITAYLSHPNIVPVYNIDFRENHPFFTMKLIEGDSLSKIIRELRKQNPKYKRRYSLNSLMDIFVKVCEAIGYAHSRGVLHLDLKPDNIRINNYGEVLVCDWGIARIINEKKEEKSNAAPHPIDADLINEITLTGTIKGTPGYMAPEQVKSELGNKTIQTDIYALGAILYAILTLHSPLDHIKDIDQVLDKTVQGEIAPPSLITATVSKSLEAICCKAMHHIQSNRYSSVNLLLTDLHNFQHGFATQAEGASLLKVLHLFIKRHKISSLLLGIITVSTPIFMFNLYQKERIATNNLKLYRQEQEVADFFHAAGGFSILQKFRNEFGRQNATSNLKAVNFILAKNPNNQTAHGLKGLAQFALRQYAEAIASFKMSKSAKYNDLILLAQQQMTQKDDLKMFKLLHKAGRYPLAEQTFETVFKELTKADERVHWIKELTVIFNKQVKAEELKIQYKVNRKYLSITGPSSIKTLRFLRHLPLNTVKVNNMNSFNLNSFKILGFKTLNLVNSTLENANALLSMQHLKHLYLDKRHNEKHKEIIEQLHSKGIRVLVVPLP